MKGRWLRLVMLYCSSTLSFYQFFGMYPETTIATCKVLEEKICRLVLDLICSKEKNLATQGANILLRNWNRFLKNTGVARNFDGWPKWNNLLTLFWWRFLMT